MTNTYQVKPGDSLSQIASSLGVPMSSISGYSSGDPNRIKVGETLSYGNSAPLPASNPANNYGTVDGYPPPRNDSVGAGYDSIVKKDPVALTGSDSKLGRPAGMSDVDYANYVRNSPFLINDPNSGTGYRNPTQADNNSYQQTYRIPTLSRGESDALVQKNGLKGLGNIDFSGLTAGQAQEMANKKKQELLGAGLTGNTSFFQVTQLNNIKKATDTLKTGLSTLTNDPWKTVDDKKLATTNLLDQTAGSYASMFNKPQDFINAYQNDPSFQAVMKDFINAGGTVGDVANKINSAGQQQGNQTVSDYLSTGQKPGLQTVSDVPNPDGTRTVKYADGTSAIISQTQNADGSVSYTPTSLGESASGNVFKDASSSFLSGEKGDLIANVNRLAKVPKEYTDLYYGTPEKIGTFQKIKDDATKSIENLTTAYGNTKQTSSDQFDFAVQKNTFDAQAKGAEIEQKRAQMKNYLTEKLASIGALSTTGAAPEALAKLDQSYDAQKTQLFSELQNTNAVLMSKKQETVNNLQNDLNTKIEDIKVNLNKSEEQIQKDILTVTNASNDKIASAITGFNKTATSTYKTFLDVTNKSSAQYLKDFIKTASGGMSADYLKQFSKSVADTTKPAKVKTGGGGSGKNPLAPTPAEQRNLQSAGLLKSPTEVKTYFLKTDPSFQKEWSRNVQLGQNANPTIDNIHKSYTDWYAQNKAKKTTSKGRTL